MKTTRLIWLICILLLAGCAETVYVAGDGKEVAMSDYSAYLNATRDIEATRSTAFYQALSADGLSSNQVLALSLAQAYGRPVSLKAPESIAEQVTKYGLPWAQLFASAGWFSSKDVDSSAIVVKGSNNHVSGVGNSSYAGRDGLNYIYAAPSVTNTTYSQKDVEDSWNGTPDYNYNPVE